MKKAGSVLCLPSVTCKNNAHEGSFEYSTDGDDYPRLHDDFPSQIVDQQVGDLVLFPSSLFHRTIPFHSTRSGFVWRLMSNRHLCCWFKVIACITINN